LGQVEDNTGLDYLNNRYHDPTLGRFISVDPLVSLTGDAFGYGNNNPTTYSDPLGLCAADGGGAREACSAARRQQEQQTSSALDFLSHKNDKGCQQVCDVAKLVFGGIDGAHRGTRKSIDGNWTSEDVADAAQGNNLAVVLLALAPGLDSETLGALVGLSQQVARMLLHSGSAWESLDNEQNWWERNGGTVSLETCQGSSSISMGPERGSA
jgi:RHS repeat-associated protein